MWDDFIGKQIRRTNRNLLILGTALLAITGTVLYFNGRDVYNFLLGPFPIQVSELATIWSPDQPKRYFLKVQGQESIPTGMQVVDARHPENVRAVVVALIVGKRLLLVETPAETHQLQFSGTLKALPPEVQSGAIPQIEKEYPNLKGAFLPVMLDATGFRNSDRILKAIFGFVLTSTAIFLMGLSLTRMAAPDKHPLFAKLERYGQLQDVRARIDSEIRGDGGGEQFVGLQITTNWVLHAAAYKTDVMAVRDILWAYPKIIKHYHSGIPTGKSYWAIIRDSRGQSVEVAGKKDSVPKLLESLQRRMPWILIGYNQPLDQLWRKEKSKFFQLLEQRRAQLPAASR